MNPSLEKMLEAIGLPPIEEASMLFAGQRRDDGWSAVETGRSEVAERRAMLAELRRRGLFPASVSGRTVLDLGCGICSTGMALADEAKLVVGIDLSRSHCISAVECVNDQKWQNVGIFMGSFLGADKKRTVPFRARTFDLIVAHHGLSRADIVPLLPELRSVLVPGGQLHLFVPDFWFAADGLPEVDLALQSVALAKHPDWHELTFERLSELAAAADLGLVRSTAAPDYTVLGDMFYMSDLYKTFEEMLANPIPGLKFGESKVRARLLVFRRSDEA